MTYVILPAGAELVADPWTKGETATFKLPVTVVWGVPYEHSRAPGFIELFSLPSTEDGKIPELPQPFKAALRYDPFVKGEPADFAQGQTEDEAWANFRLRQMK